MNKEFIPYEQALALKELGFESPYPIGGYQGGKIFYYEKGELYYDGRPMYSSDAHSGQILAPLYQQAFKFVLGIIENDSKLDRKFRTRFFLDFTYEGFVMDDKELVTTYESDEETLREIINFIIFNR